MGYQRFSGSANIGTNHTHANDVTIYLVSTATQQHSNTANKQAQERERISKNEHSGKN
jgi:hypothetical protein